MGKISSKQQMGINGKPTGIVELEITYGGNEAPFGGIDASAPPQYIDPNCFVDASGFLISSKRLTAVGYVNIGVALGSWSALYNYLGSGSFYANGKYNNFVLAYTTNRVIGPPAYTQIAYSIWVWDSGTTGVIPRTSVTTTNQYDQVLGGTAATAIIDISGYKATTVGSIDINIGGHVENVTIAINDNSPAVAANAVTVINADAACPATAVANGNQITLTTKVTGAATNATTLSVDTNQDGTPYPVILQVFQGGTDGTTYQYGKPNDPLSWVAIGESLYFGGPGTTIITYSNGVLNVLTQYLGAVTLGKFAGFLVAGGVIPGPGTVIDASEMVIAWSANGQFGIWNPLDASGNVTGAGFNEEADISDYITAMFVMASMTIILRTQGIDYLTPLGSGLQPFDFEHIANAKLGEGCQDGRLATQYGQVGIFIGNTDIFQYANGLQEIGAKIRQQIIPLVNSVTILNRDSTVGPVALSGIGVDVIARFIIDTKEYFYNLDNRTWMKNNYPTTASSDNNFTRAHFWTQSANATSGTQFNNPQVPVLVTQQLTGPIGFQYYQPVFWQLKAVVQNADFQFLNATAGYVTFIAEEIAFGRDITVDSLYVAVAGVNGQVVNFTVSGILRGTVVSKTFTLTLGPEADGSTFWHYKVYPTGGSFVGKNPQLSISLPVSATATQNPFSVEKITMFASFDSSQVPV